MRLLAFIFAAILLALRCLAQDASTGAIRGIVLDPSGKSISGATVALVNDATGLHYEQASDQAGRFAFELLAPGEYSARVAADKMSPQISPNIRVEIGGVAEINFSLLIAGARESVTVSAEPRAVETQPRGLSAVIDERAILNLPLNGRRFTVTGPSRTELHFQRRSDIRRHSRIPDQLSSGRRRQQQWIFRTSTRKVSRSLSVLE